MDLLSLHSLMVCFQYIPEKRTNKQAKMKQNLQGVTLSWVLLLRTAKPNLVLSPLLGR